MDAAAWFGPLVAGPTGPVRRDAPPTLDAALRRAAERWPDRLALEAPADGPSAAGRDDSGRMRWRYGELDAAVDRAAAALAADDLAPDRDRGPEPDRPLAALLTDDAPLAALPFVASRLGRPVLLAPLALADPALARALAAARPAALLADAATERRASALAARLGAHPPPVRPVPPLRAEPPPAGSRPGAPPAGSAAPTPNTADSDVVWLATSGSTGAPKLVRLTERGLVHAAAGYPDRLPLAEGERSLAVMPLSYVGPLTAQTVLMPLVGGCLVVAGDRRPMAAADRLVADGITHTDAVPSWLARAADALTRPAPVWRGLVYGGAPAPPDLIARLAAAQPQLALLDAWGLAEASGPVAARRTDRDPAPASPAGPEPSEPSHDRSAAGAGALTPWPGVTVRATDDAGRPIAGRGGGNDAGLGELEVAGATVSPGYAGAPPAWPAGGWLPTGDLGVVAADGAVTLRGRRRDVVLRGGATVACADVEHVLRGVDGVADVAVLAVPDHAAGEAVAAVVVPAAGSGVDPAALRARARAELGAAAVPRAVTTRDALPLGPTGKVDKERLRAEIA